MTLEIYNKMKKQRKQERKNIYIYKEEFDRTTSLLSDLIMFMLHMTLYL